MRGFALGLLLVLPATAVAAGNPVPDGVYSDPGDVPGHVLVSDDGTRAGVKIRLVLGCRVRGMAVRRLRTFRTAGIPIRAGAFAGRSRGLSVSGRFSERGDSVLLRARYRRGGCDTQITGRVFYLPFQRLESRRPYQGRWHGTYGEGTVEFRVAGDRIVDVVARVPETCSDGSYPLREFRLAEIPIQDGNVEYRADGNEITGRLDAIEGSLRFELPRQEGGLTCHGSADYPVEARFR